MKRYTFKSGDDYYVISGEECFDDQDENYSGPAIDKLAKYEDLGLTPEDIAYLAKFYKEQTSAENIEANMKSATKLLEWAKWKDLEEAGKLVILPCKISDIVYQPSYKFTACSACGITPRYKHDMDCEDCCHECDSECYPYIYEGKVCKLEVISNGEVLVGVQFKDKWDSSGYQIGRQIFLTKEEAEEKLKDI